MAIDFNIIDHRWTPKQLEALRQYQLLGSQEKAYRAAYDVTRMNDKSVQTQTVALFKKPYMKEAMALIKAEAISLVNNKMQGVAINAAWVLERVALLADFNIKKFIKVDDQGNAVYDFSNATDADWYCISEYTVEEIAKGKGKDKYFVDKTKIKTVDKIRALELVGKHVTVQAFKDQVETSGVVVNISMDKSEYKTARKEMLNDDDC